ncbi:DMT family transporter [Aestuariibaculum sediminum]|uniref:DMT family transporter n=1 Tax=Aestuariibaculum sediminum TaxID=2770637 RepID=A0A8J6U823_9FLAO|nr:DMT family transporter [Aestuariibaculum sediminum]MBD0832710.1 DMT family transporter [Aestuariibaculum sediminum]
MNRSYLELHVAILLAGFTGLFGKLVTLNEIYLVFYRVLFSSVVLLVLLAGYRWKIKVISSKKSTVKILLNGVLLALHWVFFFGSIKASTVSLGILCFCLTSFFTALLAPVINKTLFSVKDLFYSSLGFLGILVIFGFDTSYRLGVVLGIISSIFISLFTIFNEKLIRESSTLYLTTFQMIGGLIGLGIIILTSVLGLNLSFQLPNQSDMIYLLILSLLCTVVLCLLINSALKHLSSFTVNLSFNLEPIYTIVLSAIIFKEANNFSLIFWLGFALILLSIILQTITKKSTQKRLKTKSLLNK